MTTGLAEEPNDHQEPLAAQRGLYLVPENTCPFDTSAPSSVLAGLAEAVTRDGRLANLSDDELIGVLRAWQRLGSWCSAGLLTAIAELARRRPANGPPSAAPGEFPPQISEFVVDEVAFALTLTSRAADTLYAAAIDLEVR